MNNIRVLAIAVSIIAILCSCTAENIVENSGIDENSENELETNAITIRTEQEFDWNILVESYYVDEPLSGAIYNHNGDQFLAELVEGYRFSINEYNNSLGELVSAIIDPNKAFEISRLDIDLDNIELRDNGTYQFNVIENIHPNGGGLFIEIYIEGQDRYEILPLLERTDYFTASDSGRSIIDSPFCDLIFEEMVQKLLLETDLLLDDTQVTYCNGIAFFPSGYLFYDQSNAYILYIDERWMQIDGTPYSTEFREKYVHPVKSYYLYSVTEEVIPYCVEIRDALLNDAIC